MAKEIWDPRRWREDRAQMREEDDRPGEDNKANLKMYNTYLENKQIYTFVIVS